MRKVSESGGRESSGAAAACAVVVVLGAAAFGAYATYGERWRETRNTEGAITGIEILQPDDFISSAEPLSPISLDSNGLEMTSHVLQHAPWCAPGEWQVDSETTVNLCIDEESLSVSSYRVFATMRTEPFIEQIDGNPSIFKTFEEDIYLPFCLEAKEEMRDRLQTSVDQMFGSAAANYTIDIHVDPRMLQHPCDDPLPEE